MSDEPHIGQTMRINMKTGDYTLTPDEPSESAAPSGSAWRDPITDPPTKTGRILVWVRGVGPAIVNVEERWMSYWGGNDETDPAYPDEWVAWAEINEPSDPTLPTPATTSTPH